MEHRPNTEQLPQLLPLFPSDGHKGNTSVDIIAVHGIETQSPKTWTHEIRDEAQNVGVNWLCDEDMLPSKIPQARIWAYNYNSNCWSDHAQKVDILGLGVSFLEILEAKYEDIAERPLIFVGSCFGGIVIAQALERASRDISRHRKLLNSVAGVIFLATPLRGTPVASLARWIASLHGFFGMETSSTLLESLEKQERGLDTVIQDFAKLAVQKQLPIRCFYETRTTQIARRCFRGFVANYFPEAMLVSKDSTCLDGHDRIPLDATHCKMNKFSGPENGNYVIVARTLRDLVDNARIIQSRTEDERACMQCLTSNYREDKDRNRKRVSDTCKWALEHPRFLSWRQDKSNLLWISADPGCGKSVLSRALVDERLFTDSPAASVCYFFFKDDDNSRQNGAQALSAILHQLFVARPRLLKHAMPKFQNNGNNLSSMFSTLWDILIGAASDPEAGEIVCIFDALDECQESARGGFIEKLGGFFSASYQRNTKLKFLVTSRPYSDIERAFCDAIDNISQISLRGEEQSKQISEEINLVIDFEIARISSARRYPLDLVVQDALIKKLKNIPHRTYLWLQLILDVIRKSLESTRSSLVNLVDRIPRTVDEAYEKILRRIDGSDRADQARRLLHIIVAAARPLTLQEMNIALAIAEKLDMSGCCQSYCELELPSQDHFREKIREVCGLFISVVDSKVYLIHQTAKEFLIAKEVAGTITETNGPGLELWKHSLKLSDSNMLLTRVCITYLLFKELERTLTDTSISNDFPEYDLLEYAAVNWADHFRSTPKRKEETVIKAALEMCNVQSGKVRNWFELYQLRKDNIGFPQGITITDLIVATYFGLGEVVQQLLTKEGIDINARDGHYNQTALLWAARYGHAEVVQLLLTKKGIDINARDGHYNQTALLWAAQEGHAEVVQLLLTKKGIDINARDNYYNQTALLWAAQYGHAEVVQLLLTKKGVDINAHAGHFNQTALLWAAQYGYTEVVRLLLTKKGIEINARDNNDRTALLWAAQEGYTEVLQVLLTKKDIEINARDDQDRTALLLAAQEGNTEVVQLLLAKEGIEINARDNNGRTALLWAAQEGYTEVLQVLLTKKDIEINARDNKGRTALLWAAREGHAEVVRLLLNKEGIEINARDDEDRTALSWTAERGHTEVKQLLRCYH